MIVRNAIVSDEPYTLGAGSDLVKVARLVPARRLEPVLLPADTLEPIGIPAQPTLTMESVTAWLVNQEREVLTAVMPGIAAELAEIHEDAYANGFDAGQLAGRAAAQEQTAQLHGVLRQLVDAACEEYRAQHAQLATLCVEIVAIAIGKIAGPLLVTREAALGAVTEALKRAKAGDEVTLHVHPAELEWLEGERAHLTAVVSAPLTLVADARVELGGCRIESQSGTLDARLEVQLEGLFETLRAAKDEAGKS